MEPDSDAVREIVAAASRATGIAFRDYRPPVVERRIGDRMRALGIDSWREYATWLERDTGEAVRLRDSLLIRTTEPFRGPRTFAALRREVLPALARRRAGRELRAWVAACSTGEEAWSVALCLAEACDGLPDPPRFSVLASDVHEPSLSWAVHGIFPDAALTAVPKELAARYLESDGDATIVTKPLRDAVQFVRHDMLCPDQPSPKAAVLATFDLVCCRNLLIYLRPEAQARLAARLVGACEPDGVVVLDESETLGVTGWHRAPSGTGIWVAS